MPIFLDRLLFGGLCSKECFILVLIYGDRLLRLHPTMISSRRNVHRLVLASVVVASKVLDDFYCRNMFYALTGGVTKAQLNVLELELCKLLHFTLHVTPEEFTKYRTSLFPPRPGSACAPGARGPAA